MDLFEEYPRLKDVVQYGEYDFARCATVCLPDGPIDVEDAAAALIVAQGIYARAARLINRSRSSLFNLVMRDNRLRVLREDLIDEVLDYTEEVVMHVARGKRVPDLETPPDVAAAKFLLTTLGKDRGFTTRVENTGAGGKDLIPQTITDEKLKNLPDDAMAAILEAFDETE